MAEYYKFEIANWDEGTAILTLEQEAAYLRVVNAIRLKDQPLTFNMFALCGIWRCNERKAKRLLDELIAAGKLRIEDGKIINDKAVDDASNLRRLRADRASAGSRGGVESGKSRRKPLENNDTAEAIASTREEKRREEKNKEEEECASAENLPVSETLFLTVLKTCGLTNGPLPTYWMPPAAEVHVNRWIGLGLTEAEVISVVLSEQKLKPDKPRGPKAFDAAMQRLAAAKTAPISNPTASPGGRANERQAFDRSIAELAAGLSAGTVQLDDSDRNPFAPRRGKNA